MIITTYAILGFMGLVVLCIAYWLNHVRYVSAKVMTPGELRFYKVLTRSLSPDHVVLSQVRLANVVRIPDRYFVWKKFNLLGAKCVDFVIIDWKTGKTLLVIELDDKSHKNPDRRKRDKFVNSVLKEANVPIMHQSYEGNYDEKKIAKRIKGYLQETEPF